MTNFNNLNSIFDNFITQGTDKNSNQGVEIKKNSDKGLYRFQFIKELCQAIDFTPIREFAEIRQAVETIYREEFKNNGFGKVKNLVEFPKHISIDEIETLIKEMEKNGATTI